MVVGVNDYEREEHNRSLNEEDYNVSRTSDNTKVHMFYRIHNCTEILFCEDGEAEYFIKGESYHISAGDVLVIVETEAADPADRTEPLPFIGAADRLTGVLDHGDVVSAGDRHDPVHVAGAVRHVDDHDRACARGDFPFEIVRIHRQRVVDFDEFRNRLQQHRRKRRRDPGVGRDQHLIAFADPERDHRAQQRAGSGIDHECMAHAGFFRKRPFRAGQISLGSSLKAGQNSAPYGVRHRVDFRFSDSEHNHSSVES